MNTQENQQTVQIEKNVLEKLIQRNRQLAYMVICMEYICHLKKVDMTMMADELCPLLDITPQQLENCRRKRIIRCSMFGNTPIYHVFDLAILAEKLKRKK